MKVNFTTSMIAKKVILTLALAIAVIGCGKLDNLDSDDFDLFGNPDKSGMTELRRYSETPMDADPIVEFWVDKSDKMGTVYEKHVRKLCDYAKFPYRATEIKDINTSPVIPASARVICVVETKKLNQEAIDKLVEFVGKGGTILLPFAGEDTRIGFLRGFKADAEYETDVKSTGFLFTVPFLPNLKGKPYKDGVKHYGFTKENFSSNIKVLATATNDPSFPVIIQNDFGKGKVVYFNSTITMEKIERGLFFSGFIGGLEGIPYPIANTSTIFLDDFPSPVYAIKSEPIKSEMNLTIADFVQKVWWPDMKTLSNKYNISYSAMICFDYKNKTEPPFMFDQWDANRIKSNGKTEVLSDWLVKNVAKTGHELAFHGYNHVSLEKGNWKNPEFVGMAFKAVEKKWEISNFGDLPVTYVPPSNIIDKKGLDQLHKAMPSIKYMCSLYLGETAEGGNREFDFDPYNPNLFDYPRVSDGFYLSGDKSFSLESLYIFTGIWTHFIHPDDVYQIENPYSASAGDYDLRNMRGLGWRTTKGKKDFGLFSEWSDYLEMMAKTYPQLRYVNAGEGGVIVNDWRASKFRHSKGNGSYTVAEIDNSKSISEKQYWFLYGSLENAASIESQLNNESAIYSKTPYINGYLYSIYTNKSKITLRDLKHKNPEELLAMENMSRRIQNDYKTFRANVAKFNAGGYVDEWVDKSEEKFKQELASLKVLMQSESKIDTVTWNKYAKYMLWEDRGLEVWKLLDQHTAKNPTSHNIMYSRQLNKIIEYPDDIIREKWLSEQMRLNPNDKIILLEYIESFSSIENRDKISNAFKNLRKTDSSTETFIQYLKHLLAYDPPAALVELKDIVPSAEYKEIASEIAWLYADDAQLQKAYDWAVHSDQVDFASKASWLMDLKAYDLLESEYKKHIEINPNDFMAKMIMVSVFHETGRFKEAWVLANSLPESPDKKVVRNTLNADVIYVEPDLQQDLIDNHAELFLPEVLAQLNRTLRKEFGNFIAFNSIAESNKDRPSAFKNVLSYNFYDKKNNLHGIAATYSTMYKMDFTIKGDDKDNVTHAIGGVQYQFNNPKSFDKLQYWARARVELSDYQRWYYQFGMGANLSRPKSFKSAEFKIFPAETGPAHSKRIYRMQMNIYQDYYFLKYLNGSLSLEGNYYMPTKEFSAVRTEESYEGSITTKLSLDNGKERKSKFIPFLEGSLSQASVGEFKTVIGERLDASLGYPYWMVDERLYGGGGIGYKFGLEDSNFKARVEAGYFADDYSNDFQRYTGEFAYQIFNYTLLTAAFEIYVQDKFYSNIIQFGIKYNLKKRKKK